MTQTVLITGASSGIGKATARYFAQQGWNVAATMRRPENEKELNQLANVKLYRLDVLDGRSIQQAIERVQLTFGAVDVIVNNAGYAAVGAFEAASDEQIRRQFDTNVFGLMNVVREILPHFRTRKKGVIINIASMGGRITFPLYSLYHGTKWAVEGFSESLQYELEPFGIRVKIIEPGAIKTDFYERSMDIFRKEGLTAYDAYSELTFPNMQEAGEKAEGPEVVAKAIFRAATDGSKKLRYPVGSNAPLLLFLRRLIGDTWFMKVVRGVVEKQR